MWCVFSSLRLVISILYKLFSPYQVDWMLLIQNNEKKLQHKLLIVFFWLFLRNFYRKFCPSWASWRKFIYIKKIQFEDFELRKSLKQSWKKTTQVILSKYIYLEEKKAILKIEDMEMSWIFQNIPSLRSFGIGSKLGFP